MSVIKSESLEDGTPIEVFEMTTSMACEAADLTRLCEKLERVAVALGVDLDGLLTLAGHRPRAPRDDDPWTATLVAKVRQVRWTPERFLIVDALLDDLRHRSARVPIEQAALPGMDESERG
jgi:hypothetical protein